MRTLITTEPFDQRLQHPHFAKRGEWPCQWIAPREARSTPWVAAFRLPFTTVTAMVLRLHVTADERYELWLDGQRIGRGSERCDGRPWLFETYDLPLKAGPHMLVARVWALGDFAPIAQHSLVPGFFCCPDDEQVLDQFATGHAPWQAKLLDGYRFTPPLAAFGVGHNIDLDGEAFGWGFERGEGTDWLPVRVLHPGYSFARRNELLGREHMLAPATLPPMIEQPRQLGVLRNLSAPALSETHTLPIQAADHLTDEADAWQALLDGNAPLVIPPNTRRRAIIDLEDYFCAYPELLVSGGAGASIRLNWQESLFVDTSWNRGNRDEVEGKFFTTMWWNQDGLGDRWQPDGGEHRRLDTLWWQAGRYVELLVETSNTPLTLEHIRFRETRYPLENTSSFTASDERLAAVVPIAVRALQMCAHETYMDCPYFEQLMYVGDTRLEVLVTYTISNDDRLPHKALHLFNQSRLPAGLTQSRYPSRLRQIIPPFSLWWVAMVHDAMMYRDDPQLIRSLLPGTRAVLDFFTAQRGADGLVRSPNGWNYVDWVPVWNDGEPPGGRPGGVCGPLNWQYVYSLQRAAEIEAFCGEAELAARARRLAAEAVQALTAQFWDEARGLYADDHDHTIFTEHSQCLALLSGAIPAAHRAAIAKALFATTNLTQPTVYFMHYFFETCQALDRMDVFLERMEFWFEQVRLGFRTTYENGDPSTNRSDCHAWGSHPLFHYFGSLLGIRPAAPGFREVAIKPQLGTLKHATGRMVHPRGEISVTVEVVDGRLHGSVSLPEATHGILYANGEEIALESGTTSF